MAVRSVNFTNLVNEQYEKSRHGQIRYKYYNNDENIRHTLENKNAVLHTKIIRQIIIGTLVIKKQIEDHT